MKHISNRPWSLACTASLTLAGAAATSQAAENAGSTQQATQHSVLAEIVVTAQKREEQLQDVPLSITAVDQQSLRMMNADRFSDFALTVPSLTYVSAGPGRNRFTIRGITSAGGASNATVGYYLDETPITHIQRNADPKFYDLQRIEVLRGPQGTLYGANSLGGTIKFITNKPDAQRFEADTDATISTTKGGGENYALNAMVNLPLADSAALRVVGVLRETGGFIDRYRQETVTGPVVRAAKDVNNETVQGLRASLKLDLGERLTLLPSIYYQNLEMDGKPEIDTTNRLAPAVFPADSLSQVRYLPEPYSDEFTLYGLTATYDFDGMQLLSSTSYFDKETITSQDMSEFSQAVLGAFQGDNLAPGGALDDRFPFESFTQEIRLQSTGQSPWQWIVGGFYYDEQLKRVSNYVMPGYGQTYPSFATLFPLFPDDAFFLTDSTFNQKETAVFGEVSYEFASGLKLLVGLRQFWAENDFQVWVDGFFDQTRARVRTPGGDSKEDGLNPKFQLSYATTDDLMLFATAAKGFRRGGANAPVPVDQCQAALEATGISEAPDSFEADTVWNYEVGVKSTFAGGRVTLNGTVYQIDWKDIQQNVSLTCNYQYINNAGSARSRGVELELVAQLTDSLRASLSGGYTDAVLTVDDRNLGGRKNDQIQDAPKFNLAASAEYRTALGVDWDGYGRIGYQYVDESYTNYRRDSVDPGKRDPLSTRDAYGIANVRVGIANDVWDVAILGDNLFDERPIVGINTFGPGIGQFVYTTLTPRTIGLNVRRRF